MESYNENLHKKSSPVLYEFAKQMRRSLTAAKEMFWLKLLMMIEKQLSNGSIQTLSKNAKPWFPSRKGEGLRVRLNVAVVTFLILLGVSCNRKPFVNHKLKFEKISDNCENLKPSFRMVSNVAGERYEFEKCLDANFTKDMMKISRVGDTVLVQFPKAAGQTVLDKMTLDVDSYPRYNFITIDDETFNVIPSN